MAEGESCDGPYTFVRYRGGGDDRSEAEEDTDETDTVTLVGSVDSLDGTMGGQGGDSTTEEEKEEDAEWAGEADDEEDSDDGGERGEPWCSVCHDPQDGWGIYTHCGHAMCALCMSNLRANSSLRDLRLEPQLRCPICRSFLPGGYCYGVVGQSDRWLALTSGMGVSICVGVPPLPTWPPKEPVPPPPAPRPRGGCLRTVRRLLRRTRRQWQNLLFDRRRR